MDRQSYYAPALLLLAGCTRLAAAPVEGLWQGTLDAGVRLRIDLTISRSPGGMLKGHMDSVDQGMMGLPINKITAKFGAHESSLRFESRAFGATFDGVVRDNQIEGRWKMRRAALPVVFRRVLRFRPQDPVPPFPYDAEEVAFENRAAGVRFAGTLTLPRTGRPAPAVLLISGSGPEDRDAATAGHRPFLVLADYLARRGIAALRVDDRGVGGSTGRNDDAALDALAGDTLAAVEFLKTRPELDARRIGLLGHSEGALVAPLAATRSSDVAYVVLLGSPGIPGEQLIAEQSYALPKSMGVPEEIAARNRELQKTIFEILRHEPDNATARRRIREHLATVSAGLSPDQRQAMTKLIARTEAEIPRLTSPAFRAFLTYDPRPTLQKLPVPVLAITGALDLQAPPAENLPEMARALETGGTRAYRIVKLPGLNHLLQTARTGSPLEYANIEETMAPAALETIASWIETTAATDK